MSMQQNRYMQALNQDFDALKQKWDEMRQHVDRKDGSSDGANGSGANGSGGPDSKLAQTAWDDFQEQSRKMQAAGETASDELRGSYEAARDKVRRIADSYRSG
ncbi:hypothetical protein [Roseospira goensis]|uniref:Uncharacterized protein n=1 Tax=Roseospira goensis TaxID=391922 RepID=A0A7W6S2M2_9PROT|nr:hypothetical protein [Roseospira goensis]MBB4287591.1 hypothetical protein [Roseospira goensis]